MAWKFAHRLHYLYDFVFWKFIQCLSKKKIFEMNVTILSFRDILSYSWNACTEVSYSFMLSKYKAKKLKQISIKMSIVKFWLTYLCILNMDQIIIFWIEKLLCTTIYTTNHLTVRNGGKAYFCNADWFGLNNSKIIIEWAFTLKSNANKWTKGSKDYSI